MKELCEGCKFLEYEAEGYCYIFETAPEFLPCGQHDMYKDAREFLGRVVMTNPELLKLILGGLIENEI